MEQKTYGGKNEKYIYGLVYRFIKLIERPRFPEPNSPSNENKKEDDNNG